MSIELKMPALSPTMEKGTLAKWLVKEGDVVKAGEQVAEIETDKATMEFEIADGGIISKILVAEGTDDVLVGTVIALLSDGDEQSAAPSEQPEIAPVPVAEAPKAMQEEVRPEKPAVPVAAAVRPAPDKADVPWSRLADKVKVSPLAARIAAAKDLDLSKIVGTGPGGRIVRADLGLPAPEIFVQGAAPAQPIETKATVYPIADVPHELQKLSGMRKTIARRLTESKQQVPHIYLTVDIALEALLKLRLEVNAGLASRNIKISVNDMMIKALALALTEVPVCNVQFAGDQLAQFKRADISVAVSIPNGLITPVVRSADSASLSGIASAMKALAERAREGKLQPDEYQGGTASLSNLGMFGIKQFQAVINPPQAMIMAVGAGDLRAVATSDGIISTQMLSATGSFDHRAINGADAARLMSVFKVLVEEPLHLVA